MSLVTVVVRFMEVLTGEKREKVLIIDDSTYDRSRSKVVDCWPGCMITPVVGASRD